MEYNIDKISARLARKKLINKIVKKIISVILIFICVVNSILLYYNLKGDKTPKLFRYVFF